MNKDFEEIIEELKHGFNPVIKPKKSQNNNIDKQELLRKYQELKLAYYQKHQELLSVFEGYRDLYMKAKEERDSGKEEIYWAKLDALKKLLLDCQNKLNYKVEVDVPETKPLKLKQKEIIKHADPLKPDIKNPDIKALKDIEKIRSGPFADSRDVDVAYVKKHNELMTLYKAYQVLYQKVSDYKQQFDQLDDMHFQSSIKKEELDMMIVDQNRVMASIGTMQDKMIEGGILMPEQKVEIESKSPKAKIERYNHQLYDQLVDTLETVDMDPKLDPKDKAEIKKILDDNKLSTDQKVKKILTLTHKKA